jgi:putative oxidoreductase
MSLRNTTVHIYSWLNQLDRQLVGFMSTYGIHLLRWSIAIVYLWFGALKLINASPAAELVVRTVFWLPQREALLFIGGWEVLIGLGLLATHPMILRVTLFLLWLQVAGTFQVFILLPQVAFEGGNPLLPTLEGQYAIKNLVLIAAGLVIGSTVRQPRRG